MKARALQAPLINAERTREFWKLATVEDCKLSIKWKSTFFLGFSFLLPNFDHFSARKGSTAYHTHTHHGSWCPEHCNKKLLLLLFLSEAKKEINGITHCCFWKLKIKEKQNTKTFSFYKERKQLLPMIQRVFWIWTHCIRNLFSTQHFTGNLSFFKKDVAKQARLTIGYLMVVWGARAETSYLLPHQNEWAH